MDSLKSDSETHGMSSLCDYPTEESEPRKKNQKTPVSSTCPVPEATFSGSTDLVEHTSDSDSDPAGTQTSDTPEEVKGSPEGGEEPGEQPEKQRYLDIEFEERVKLEPLESEQFGVSIYEILGHTSIATYQCAIPTVLVNLWDNLLKSGGCKSVGVFRVNPQGTEADLVRQQATSGRLPADSDENAVANSIKVFYRTLPNPILETLTFGNLTEIAADKDLALKALRDLKEPCRSIVMFAVDFCAVIASYEHLNKMSAHNMGIIFAPNLFPMDEDDPMAGFYDFSSFLEKVIEARLEWREKHEAGGYQNGEVDPFDWADSPVERPPTEKEVDVLLNVGATHSGELLVFSGMGFKARWFQIFGDRLRFFTNDRCTDLLSVIDLRSVIMMEPDTKKGPSFSITTNSRQYDLSAYSRDDRDEWLRLICESVCQTLNSHETDSSPCWGAHEVYHKGLLTKQGQIRRTWKKRFFALTRRSIFYFASQSDCDRFVRMHFYTKEAYEKAFKHYVVGEIPIENSVALEPDVCEGRNFCFQIVTNDRSTFLQALNEEERETWVSKVLKTSKALSKIEQLKSVNDTGGGGTNLTAKEVDRRISCEPDGDVSIELPPTNDRDLDFDGSDPASSWTPESQSSTSPTSPILSPVLSPTSPILSTTSKSSPKSTPKSSSWKPNVKRKSGLRRLLRRSKSFTKGRREKSPPRQEMKSDYNPSSPPPISHSASLPSKKKSKREIRHEMSRTWTSRKVNTRPPRRSLTERFGEHPRDDLELLINAGVSHGGELILITGRNSTKRWFQIFEGRLRYFEDKSCKNILDVITLSTVVSISPGKKAHSTLIKTSEIRQQYCLIADTDKNRDEWISLLCEASSNAKKQRSCFGFHKTFKSGWLTKKGQIRKTWKTRFFILTSQSILYFVSDTHCERFINVHFFSKEFYDKAFNQYVLGEIPIDEAIMHQPNLCEGKEFCFQIVTKERQTFLEALNDDDRASWVNETHKIIKRKQQQQLQNSPSSSHHQRSKTTNPKSRVSSKDQSQDSSKSSNLLSPTYTKRVHAHSQALPSDQSKESHEYVQTLNARERTVTFVSQTSKRINDWTVSDVCNWLRTLSPKVALYSNLFVENNIDGYYLLNSLTEDQLYTFVDKSLIAGLIWRKLELLKKTEGSTP